MPLLDILIHPDRRLRKTAEPVSQFTNALKTITDNMFATMYEAHGIGLAAERDRILCEEKSLALLFRQAHYASSSPLANA